MDYFTNPDVLLFYLIPILIAAFFAGKRAGVWVSIASAIAWFIADIISATHSPHSFIPYWNMAIELGIFLVVTSIMSALVASRKRQEDLMQFVIHDLRSPLANMLAGLQTLQRISEEDLDETQEELIEIALASGQRMEVLINSLLDLSRMEDGQMPLHPEETDVRELVESSLEQVAIWAARSQIYLETHLNEQISTVRADATVTMRVLTNLLSNAVKVSRRGSVVTICVAPFGSNYLAFSVTDQGPGIPPEWVDKVFDKFHQIDARKEGAALGSGLGLTFCQLAIRAQGGRIWLKSEPDKGTTVTFTLPVKD